ncbi:MAG TPA: DinB family protein [Candidatus Limnocylindria bacterium]|nr:DinB family protein [Candidatus Limnocylindria bacterium]
MPTDRSHDADNDTQRERLRSLVSRLSDEQLRRPMPDGWTVAGVLAHAAFWDARAIFALGKWRRGIPPPPGDYEPDDPAWINDSAKPLCLAITPRDAADLALRLAEEADAGVRALDDETVAKVRELGPFSVSRAGHRREHLDEIERALGIS